jgi:hypothetical protein
MTKWERNMFEPRKVKKCANPKCNNPVSRKDKKIKYCWRHQKMKGGELEEIVTILRSQWKDFVSKLTTV